VDIREIDRRVVDRFRVGGPVEEGYPFFADHEGTAAPRTIPVVALTRA
jgi:hypothetical protein